MAKSTQNKLTTATLDKNKVYKLEGYELTHNIFKWELEGVEYDNEIWEFSSPKPVDSIVWGLLPEFIQKAFLNSPKLKCERKY